MDDLVGIFPTPVMLCRQALPPEMVEALKAVFEESATGDNVRTALLKHTPMASPRSSDAYLAVYKQVAPKLVAFGEALLGEQMNWAVKEIWINRMETGGAQKMHNHANSFVSGVIYLTPIHASAATVFHRFVGSTGFMLENQNERCKMTSFNSPVYRTPEVEPGDMMLFPSYVMHEVPPNQGEPRMTAAFNAIPERLDSWGYRLQFR